MAKRIFFTVSRMHGGGAQRVMVHLLNHMIENTDADITLILFKSKAEDAYLPLISKKCRIVVLNTTAKFGWYKLSRLIRREKPDVLFSTLNYINIAAISATLFAASNLKLVIREARPISKTHKFVRTIQKLLYWRVDLFWAITPIIKEEMHAMLNVANEKIRLAPNPIDIKTWIADKQETPSTPPPQIVKLLYVGRLIELKNVELIIKALDIIKHKSWHLKIVGTGPLEHDLKALVGSLGLDQQIEFVGYSNNVYRFMQESDIFMLASRFEGFPNVIVEALACENLCIANDTEGGGVKYIKTIIDQLIIADYKNPNEIADLITYYIDYPAELEKIKTLGAQQSEQLQIKKYFDIYMKDILL